MFLLEPEIGNYENPNIWRLNESNIEKLYEENMKVLVQMGFQERFASKALNKCDGKNIYPQPVYHLLPFLLTLFPPSFPLKLKTPKPV